MCMCVCVCVWLFKLTYLKYVITFGFTNTSLD